jgi:hypothetical protein
MRKMVRCAMEQMLAANSTVTVCVCRPQATHHMADELPRARRMVRVCLSIVTLVFRFAKAHHPFCAGGRSHSNMASAHDRRNG